MADVGADGGAGGAADGAGRGGRGAGGEWWRSEQPWRAIGAPRLAAAAAPADEQSVYAPDGAPAAEPPRAAPGGPAPGGPAPAEGLLTGGPGAGLNLPGWEVVEYPDGVDLLGRPAADLPAPRAEATAAAPAPEAPAEPAPVGLRKGRGRKAPGSAGPAADPAPKTAASGLFAGRRPSPLLLFAAAALLAGAVTGQLLAMLLGWGAAYLSRQFSDLARKVVVLGIPLATMFGSAVWYWGRTKGRWGQPLAEGAAMNHAVWTAAPDVLRAAAVITALALLAVTLRRRKTAD
ncbi:hypothetical protein [Streptomyces sp. NRRL B-24484]|uniref:hypothetical protein n=1 Tax=Streptomyces sp. NRRL B-24484 TaxID=1463833 RepID=UPI0006942B83|nr:hypothetical protein [Streptomyces sp. NRRL B-24484]